MAEKTNKSDAPAAGDAGADEVQAAFDAAADKGYFGTSPDPTPRAAYSVAGQLRAMPVPETDPAAAVKAEEAARALSEAPAAGPKPD